MSQLMSSENHIYDAWIERIISEEKKNCVLHYYLCSSISKTSLLAAVGTEKNNRHYKYVVSKEFLEAFRSSQTINARTKWTARHHVTRWLISLVRKDKLPPTESNLPLVPKHNGNGSSIKRVRLLEEDLIMRFPKKPRSSRVRRRQDSGSLDAIAAREPTGVQLLEPKPNHQASLEVGDKIEVLCQDNGMRGCWFKCKVVKIFKKCLKVQLNDVEDAKGSGILKEWLGPPKLAPADELSMRQSGRLTIRPCPPEEEPPASFEVGAAVDAWWSNGWWESLVVPGVPLSNNDKFHVFLISNGRFLILDRKDLRVSRDWVGDKWVAIKSHPDVISQMLYTI